MNAWTVRCATCQHRWNLVGNWSEYERQAIESRPCPKCGAYALCCPEPTRPTAKTSYRSGKWATAKAG